MGIETVISLLAGKLGSWLATGMGLLALFFAARQSGKSAATAKVNEERLEAINEAKRIEREVDEKTDDEIDAEAKKWTR